jgi:hypothetical protein
MSKKNKQHCKWPDYICKCEECSLVSYYELWSTETEFGESCMFSPTTTNPNTYHLLTHNIDDEPMVLIASWKSTYQEARIIYEDILGYR